TRRDAAALPFHRRRTSQGDAFPRTDGAGRDRAGVGTRRPDGGSRPRARRRARAGARPRGEAGVGGAGTQGVLPAGRRRGRSSSRDGSLCPARRRAAGRANGGRLVSVFVGQVAVVTGATRGIGRAIALELGRQGGNVAFSYRSRADLAEALTRELEARA